MLAGAGGLVLLLAMFLPWFDGRLSGRGAQPVPVTATGWESYGGFFDVLIVALAAVPIAIAVGRAAGSLPVLPLEQGVMVLGAGVLLVVMVGFRVIDPPDVIDVAIPGLELDTSRKPPLFVALLAAGAVGVGGRLQR